jgi:peptidoglycan/LPS O-acetylase OafA/YrhL
MLLAVALREKENGMNPALNAIRHFKRAAPAAVYYGLLIILTTIACYTAYYSGVGQGALKEQLISIVTTCTLVALFALKRFEIGLFAFTGFYSYEIYLLHWPLLSRYDIFYRHTPAWLATVLYLALFFGLGWLIQKATTAFEENKLLAVKSK